MQEGFSEPRRENGWNEKTQSYQIWLEKPGRIEEEMLIFANVERVKEVQGGTTFKKESILLITDKPRAIEYE